MSSSRVFGGTRPAVQEVNMRYRVSAQVLFRRKDDGQQVGEPGGFSCDKDSSTQELDGPWASGPFSWLAKEDPEVWGELELGTRFRSQDPAGTLRLGGRVRFFRDGQQVGEDDQVVGGVALADLTDDWTVVKTTTWDVTDNIEGRIRIGAMVPTEEGT
jgi:hypothetical protein